MHTASEIIEKVKAFTNEAHGDQRRRYSDDPYIVHPVRVMKECAHYTDDISVLCAAILHDVLEDTPVTESGLSDFLHHVMSPSDAARTLRHVVELTDVFTKASYPRMNRRSRKQHESKRLSRVSVEAQTIKYADIIDNTDVTTNDPDFARTYLSEAKSFLNDMKDGNTLLRQKALKRVEECLLLLKSRQNMIPPR